MVSRGISLPNILQGHPPVDGGPRRAAARLARQAGGRARHRRPGRRRRAGRRACARPPRAEDGASTSAATSSRCWPARSARRSGARSARGSSGELARSGVRHDANASRRAARLLAAVSRRRHRRAGGDRRGDCARLPAGVRRDRVWCLDRPGQPAPAQARRFACDVTDRGDGRPRDRRHRQRPPAGSTSSCTRRHHARRACCGSDGERLGSRCCRRNLDVRVPPAARRGSADARAAGPGAVVLVSSINGERGKVGQANYAASKAGLNALGADRRARARALRHPRERDRARLDRDADDGVAARRICASGRCDESPLGRLGEPDDVARATLFLVADSAATSRARCCASTAAS